MKALRPARIVERSAGAFPITVTCVPVIGGNGRRGDIGYVPGISLLATLALAFPLAFLTSLPFALVLPPPRREALYRSLR